MFLSLILQTIVPSSTALWTLMSKPVKMKMREELENKACLTTKDFVFNDSIEEAVLIAFMSSEGKSLDT